MRKVLLFLSMALALFLTGCKEDTKDMADILVGQWTLENYIPATKGVIIGQEPVSVTVVFLEDNSFMLYQRIGEAFTETFQGTWTLEGNTLSGVYSDKKPWGEQYDISFSDNDNTLEMKAVTAKEIYVYQRYIPKE